MLWKIEGSRTFILGSIHITNMEELPLSSAIEQAYAASTNIIFETDLDETPDTSLLPLPANGHLNEILSEDLYERTKAHWLRLGFIESDLNKSRPGFAARQLQISIASQHCYTHEKGVDRYFWRRAHEDEKRIFRLESSSEQLALLINSPIEEEISLLEHIALQEDAGLSELAAKADAWNNHDFEYFERIANRDIHRWPLTSEVLLAKRNQKWIPELVTTTKEQTAALFVVGVLHLPGESGLISLLTQTGLHLIHCPKGA